MSDQETAQRLADMANAQADRAEATMGETVSGDPRTGETMADQGEGDGLTLFRDDGHQRADARTFVKAVERSFEIPAKTRDRAVEVATKMLESGSARDREVGTKLIAAIDSLNIQREKTEQRHLHLHGNADDPPRVGMSEVGRERARRIAGRINRSFRLLAKYRHLMSPEDQDESAAILDPETLTGDSPALQEVAHE